MMTDLHGIQSENIIGVLIIIVSTNTVTVISHVIVQEIGHVIVQEIGHVIGLERDHMIGLERDHVVVQERSHIIVVEARIGEGSNLWLLVHYFIYFNNYSSIVITVIFFAYSRFI